MSRDKNRGKPRKIWKNGIKKMETKKNTTRDENNGLRYEDMRLMEIQAVLKFKR